MAKLKLRNKALEMRKQNMSYSQIKETLNVSKSTLSLWLRDHPLSNEKIRELRAVSEKRIERYRATMAQKKEKRQERVFTQAQKNIQNLTKRELYLAGVFLYWAEGTKSAPGLVQFTNTDPHLIRFFLRWLEQRNVQLGKMRVYLHLYQDMSVTKEIKYWSNTLALPRTSFRKPYIKKTKSSKRTNYKGRHGHGTCNLIVHSRDIYEEIMMSISYIQSMKPR